MEKLMLQFHHPGQPPTLGETAQIFDLSPDEIDADFGVIATDPDARLYTVLIDARARAKVEARLAARGAGPAEGVFANPRIEPTDPP